ncbi:uncharacterized protein EDB91DRAFT_576255 [Suillus paluster]|uniref:uncharacterized protein n=1 Tax=Suillus paluster TaxID=48578 RepID=UPI001B86CE8A|nr:uncharacterized protein EDB91DRAFT_576255 [Suillus paluster]KAG1734911.1 hypothetical protein EDB91DRAFT_576255 [Suillus paluster]
MVQITPLLQVLVAAAQAAPLARDVSPNALAIRQDSTSELPSQCQSICQVVDTITTCSTTVSCICASAIGPELQSCLVCVVAAEPSTQTEAQSALDSWNEACGGSLTLTSGNSTVTASGSSTVTTGGSSTTSASSTTSTKTTSTSSSGSSPLVGGGVVGMKAATGAFSLAVAIVCGILIL